MKTMELEKTYSAARSLQILSDRGIAEATRGTGYSVAPDATSRARTRRREQFFIDDLPGLLCSHCHHAVAGALSAPAGHRSICLPGM